jgi:hypothetical protein
MKGYTALGTHKSIRLGYDELAKLPLFLDTSRMIPGGDIFDVSPNAMGLPIPQPITPSHPLFTIAVAMLVNKDSFTGKELINMTDTREIATAKRAAWLWKQVTPAITAGNYHWDKMMNALAQLNGGDISWVPDILGGASTGVGKDGQIVQPKYAVMQTFGIKLRPIDMDQAESMDMGDRMKLMRDIEHEYQKFQRWNAVGAMHDRTLEKEGERLMQEYERVSEGLTVDGDTR